MYVVAYLHFCVVVRYYLRQGGYVFARLCLFVCMSAR